MTANQRAKVGVLLIVIGIAIPVAGLFFIDNWHPNRDLFGNLTRAHIDIIPKPRTITTEQVIGNEPIPGLRLEYKWLALVGVASIAVGAYLRLTHQNN